MQAPAAGMKVKSYTLESSLGSGASGEVWLANDGTKQVAIKFMNEALMQGPSAAKHRQRLEREIKALTTLKHPNIPALYDYDLNSDRPYLVMQFIAAPSYDVLIASGEMLRIPVMRRLDLLDDIARALTAAHNAGIVHRDIKPGNMNGTDTPYLLDFSIALEKEDVEHTNFNIGTTIYMTPDEEPPDRLSDNYSFAIVAYEVLFGVHPIFPPEDKNRMMGAFTRLQAFQRLKTRDWRFPSRVAKNELPLDLRGANLKQLDHIFERAMGPRDKRYEDLSQFVDEIKSAILVADNEKYIKEARELAATLPPIKAGAVPGASGYTKLEVERQTKTKPVPPAGQKTPGPFDQDDFTAQQMASIPGPLPPARQAPPLPKKQTAPLDPEKTENFTREMVALDMEELKNANPSVLKRLMDRFFGKKS